MIKLNGMGSFVNEIFYNGVLLSGRELGWDIGNYKQSLAIYLFAVIIILPFSDIVADAMY